MNLPLLADLAQQFGLLSFLAIGGVNALIPEIHRRVVENAHWLTDADFAQAFAIAQAAPGPEPADRQPDRMEGATASSARWSARSRYAHRLRR